MKNGYVFRCMRGDKAVDSTHLSPPFHSIDVTLPAQTHTPFVFIYTTKCEFALEFLLMEYKFPRTKCFKGGPPPLSIPTQAECYCNRNKSLLLATSLPQWYAKCDKHFVQSEASCDEYIDF